jgi:hypothetical protein
MTNVKGDSLSKRFFSKIERTDACWNWTGIKWQSGYGDFRTYKDNKSISTSAHRYSWELHFGEIPEGMYVLHKCDNRGCVNPEHLFLGTQKENIQDMVNKGRAPINALRGTESPKAKLTADQVREIRKLYENPTYGFRKIAKMFGVSKHSISLIVKKESYKDVT